MLIDHVIGGKYRITELIGQGGMGTVFEAVHNGTGSRVAIKLIVSNDIKEEVFVRFQREARAAAAIDSHHIVRIFDMGTDERSGSPFMVMERLFGEDVSQLMRRVGPLSPAIACALSAQSALGLAKAHEKGVVHRDIKPANLFLHDGGDNGEVVVKILDFGIAKVLMDVMQRSEEGGLTRTGSMLGSPHYMSPEQAQGLRTIDHRSDIWSLGVVLYKMLCGQTPHAHLQTLGQVILAICSQRARPIQELAPWVPPEVAHIVHRALQPDPAQRYQTAYEMYSALQAAFPATPAIRRVEIVALSSTQRMRVAAPGPGHGVRPDVPTNGTQHGMTQSPVQPAPARSSGIVIAMVAAGVMAAIGLAGIGAAMVAKKPAHAVAGEGSSAGSAGGGQGGGQGVALPVLTPVPIAVDPKGGAAVTPTAPAERTVTVAVSPANAVVEIDGTRREVKGGVVEIKGPLGAVVAVKIVAAGPETTQTVAITESGALPAKIVAAPPAVTAPLNGNGNGHGSAAGGSRTGGGKTGTATGGQATKPAPSATGTTLNAQRNFE